MPFSLNNKGFTLIEIIAVLVLTGIVTVFAGKGVSLFINGFFFARDNAATAIKAEVAMMRITKEFQEQNTSFLTGTTTSMTYSNIGIHAISLCNTTFLCIDGDKLVDSVNSFTFEYFDAWDGSAGPFNTFSTRLIKITMELVGPDDIPISFVKNIAVRNLITICNEWKTDEYYDPGDSVCYNNNPYICDTSNYSSPSYTPGRFFYWTEYDPDFGYQDWDDYSILEVFSPGDIVTYNGQKYICGFPVFKLDGNPKYISDLITWPPYWNKFDGCQCN